MPTMIHQVRIDGYLLAQACDGEWQEQWCNAMRTASGGWQFGSKADALLPPKRSRTEDNRYFEALGVEKSTSVLDLAYRHLQEFLPAPGSSLDVVLGAGLTESQLEILLGMLEALGHTPRHLIPRALAAARALPPGTHQLLELERDRSFISTVAVLPDRVRLDSVAELGAFGLSTLFTQWFELVAEAFAARHRFNIHRNLNANRRNLFRQLHQVFARPDSVPVMLACDEYSVQLEASAFKVAWPERLRKPTNGSLYHLLPLPQALPLPAQLFDLPPCADPGPQTYVTVAANLEEDARAHCYQELPT